MEKHKMKIAHSLEQLEQQTVLTLKDKPLLYDGAIDQEEDILQNDEIQYLNEARHNSQIRSKLKTIADVASSHMEAKIQGKNGILPHYDDYSFKPSEIVIEEGKVVKTLAKTSTKKIADDYLPSSARDRLNAEYRSKTQSIKKGPAKKTSQDLLKFLQETAEDDKVDAPKRQYQSSEIIGESLEQIRKKRMLDRQVKAEISSQKGQAENDEEILLLQSIQRSRRKLLQQNQPQKQAADSVLEIIQEQSEEKDNDHPETVEIKMNPVLYKTTETMRQAKQIQIKEAVRGVESAMFVNLPSERLARKETTEKNTYDSFKDITPEELQKMREEVRFMEDRAVGIGLAGALTYLRENALMGQQQQVGRANDKQAEAEDPNDRIKLQYRNANGKKMKPKEAFRYISAIFHGQGPGKNKIEKRKKKQLEELRMKEKTNTDGKLLGLLLQHQEKSGEAHLVLNLHGKQIPK